MRKTMWLGILCLAASVAAGACGSSGGGTTGTQTTGDQGTGGTTATSTTTTTTTTGTTTSGTTTLGTGGAGGSSSVNGCEEATAEDHTGDNAVTIDFGGVLGEVYKPACIKIKTGTVVTWSGDFSFHPLTPGVDGTPDTSNTPITTTNTGMSASFTFATAGTFPYFCANHFSFGMEGAVFVQ